MMQNRTLQMKKKKSQLLKFRKRKWTNKKGRRKFKKSRKDFTRNLCLHLLKFKIWYNCLWGRFQKKLEL